MGPSRFKFNAASGENKFICETIARCTQQFERLNTYVAALRWFAGLT